MESRYLWRTWEDRQGAKDRNCEHNEFHTPVTDSSYHAGWDMNLWATVSFVYFQTDPGRFRRETELVDSSAQRQSCLAKLHSSVYVWRQTRTPEKWTMRLSLFFLYMHTVWEDAYTCTLECVSRTLTAKPSRCHWLSVEPSWDFHCGVKAADRPQFICSLTTHTHTKSVKKCARMLSSPRQQLNKLPRYHH